jgi:hypothetical protein
VALPDTNLTRALLTWDMSVFLFDENLGGRNTFKIVTQESDLQAAVEHYSTE